MRPGAGQGLVVCVRAAKGARYPTALGFDAVVEPQLAGVCHFPTLERRLSVSARRRPPLGRGGLARAVAGKPVVGWFWRVAPVR